MHVSEETRRIYVIKIISFHFISLATSSDCMTDSYMTGCALPMQILCVFLCACLDTPNAQSVKPSKLTGCQQRKGNAREGNALRNALRCSGES